MRTRVIGMQIRRSLAIIMTAIIVLGTIGNYPLFVKAGEGDPRTVRFGISCSEMSEEEIPNEYLIHVEFYKDGTKMEGPDHWIGYKKTDSGINNNVDVVIPTDCTTVRVEVQPAEKDIYCNDVFDEHNDWCDKTIDVSDLEDSYNFTLKNHILPPGGEDPIPSDITDDMWSWDASIEKYKYVIDNSNPGSDFNDIYVPTDKVLIIAKDYQVKGTLKVGMFGTVQIEKGCTLSVAEGGNLEIDNLATVILGDGSSSGLISPLKVKKTGDGTLYDYDKTIDKTEFIYIDGNYIFYDGPDCGFNFNSGGSIEIFDEYDHLVETRGSVDYKVTTDGEVVCEGTFEHDWQEVNVLPEKFKAGTVVEFTVHVAEGCKIQTNGVRFPNNKNTISNKDDESNSTITCSYTLTETPDQFLSLTVDFIKPGEEMNFAGFHWSYESTITQTPDGWDKYIEHGIVEIVSVTKDGVAVTSSGNIENPPYWTPNGDYYEDQNDGNGHSWKEKVAFFEPGTEVVVRLIPDRGYQLTRFNISNIAGSTRAVDGVNEYTFVITRPDFFHLSAVFSPVEDKVDASATGINGGNVSFADNEVTNGTMALYVTNASPSEAEMNTFEEMASNEGYAIDKCINLTSEQRFYKGVENASRDDCWVINKSELSSPAQITLDVSDIGGTEVQVLHNHNGSYEVIPATYSDGKISFSAQSFSDFAIVSKGEKPSGEDGGNSGSGDSSSDSSSSTSNSGADNTSNKTDEAEKKEATTAEVVTEEKEEIAVSTDGKSFASWSALENYLIDTGKDSDSSQDGNKTETEKEGILQLIMSEKASEVPEGVFAALEESSVAGVQMVLSKDVAITFANDSKIATQSDVDLSCKVIDGKLTNTLNYHVISFNSIVSLNATTYIHTIVPAGTKMVAVFVKQSNGKYRFVKFMAPKADGSIAGQINCLGTVALVY